MQTNIDDTKNVFSRIEDLEKREDKLNNIKKEILDIVDIVSSAIAISIAGGALLGPCLSIVSTGNLYAPILDLMDLFDGTLKWQYIIGMIMFIIIGVDERYDKYKKVVYLLKETKSEISKITNNNK